MTSQITRGQIAIDISKQDLECIEFLDFSQCYQQLPEIIEYYNKHNSSIWQKFHDSPDWVHTFSKDIPQDFTHHEVSVIKLLPGHTIPYHRDRHYLLQKNYGIGRTYRYLIFLEDWKTGHYFEIHSTPIVKWQQGDWIRFGKEDWHLAGNMGIEPFYSAQVTVLKVDK